MVRAFDENAPREMGSQNSCMDTTGKEWPRRSQWADITEAMEKRGKDGCRRSIGQDTLEKRLGKAVDHCINPYIYIYILFDQAHLTFLL
jgi:hypothetical protein